MNAINPKTYISAKETAKLIRTALKDGFPGVKFSVRIRHHNAADIKWEMGPTDKQVKTITDYYIGSSFDGMQDLSMPVTQTDKDGNKVHYGTDYISLERTYTREFTERIADMVSEFWGEATPELNEYGWYDSERKNILGHDCLVDLIRKARHHATVDDDGSLTFHSITCSWMGDMLKRQAVQEDETAPEPEATPEKRTPAIYRQALIEVEAVKKTTPEPVVECLKPVIEQVANRAAKCESPEPKPDNAQAGIEGMERQEIIDMNQVYKIRKAQLHESLFILRKELGSDNEAVQILWEEYLRLDEEANPFAVKVGQIIMQDQIFNPINY